MLRLRVAEYFDSVINEIDLYTETKIQSIKTQTEEDWWNKRRQEQIDEVRRIERACLDHVNTLKVEEREIESGEWMKRVFVEYCFTVDFDGLLYLTKAYRYVERLEKRLLKVHLIKGDKEVNIAINNHQSIDVIIEEFEVNLRDYFLSDAPVIDISSGLNQCCRIKNARALETEQSPIRFDVEDLTIKSFSLSLSIENAGEEKEAVDVIKGFMTRRDNISTIEIDLQYYDHINPSQDMIALAKSIELNDQVKYSFRKSDSYFQEFDLSGLFEKYTRKFSVNVVNWQFIWYISLRDVLLEDLENADLSSLHSLTHLFLNLQISSTGKRSSDWKFLDACRASLEHLVMSCYERKMPLYLSSNTFRGMTKLKSLQLSDSFSVDPDSQEELFGDLAQLDRLFIFSFTIPFVLSRKRLSGMVNLKSLELCGSFSVDTDSQEELFADLIRLEKLDINFNNCTTPFPLSRKTFCSMTNLRDLILRGAFSIETNNQEELFTDLVHLKRLVMYLNEQMLANKWFIHSPALEQLRLTFDKSPKEASSQIRFNLPKLASLELYFNCNRIYFDLTDMMSCFSHVKKLKITSSCFDIMTKGWFHQLTSVEELDFNLQSEGHINSQLFEEFSHLTELTIFLWHGNILDNCAFNKLVHLETVTLGNYEGKYKSFNGEDKSIFDGLNSLRTIEYMNCYPHSRAYVYFENLDRLILIVK